MQFGVCYYPEHWPPERWPKDAVLMRRAGISLVRLAEFAWAIMEPREGEFDWDWLDRAIDALAAEDLKVILGTPTASPPPWMCRAAPDILPVDAQGRRRRYGSRRHYCPNNTNYHQHTERIVSAMAGRYGFHSAVIGWQIDNEFGCHNTARCYCEICADGFRHWLKAKYEDTGVLNDAWGSIFWSQTYRDWDEIEPPNLTIAEPNPSHVLDHYRFCSDSYLGYQDLQLRILKSYVPDHQIITTNFMSQFTDLDYQDLAQPLDVVTMSSYPTGQAEATPSLYMPGSDRPVFPYDVGDPYLTGLGHTLTRGFRPDRSFWVMEQQCGNINWTQYNTGVRSGTVRLWTWHALASGAEAVVYFRWRASLFAQEQYHSGLLRHDASPGVGYQDLEKMAVEGERMAEIALAPHEVQIAVLLDYDALWSLQLQPHRRELNYMRAVFLYFRAAQRLGLPIDVVSTDADLSRYKIVILPTACLGTEQLADALEAFTQAGGIALFGVRSGFKTQTNQFTDQPLPGVFRDLAGIEVSEWHSLPPGSQYDLDSRIQGLNGSASTWAEALDPTNAEPQMPDSDLQVLAQYNSGPFSGEAALTERSMGEGRVYYLGWYPNGSQAEALLEYLAAQTEISSLASAPDGVIVAKRGHHLILLNFTDEPQDATVDGQIVTVGPRDVEVVQDRKT